jgi:ribosomal protein L11 methylase PrmA
VLAVDCNPIAVRAALRNAARNRWDDRIYGIAANSLNAVQTHQSALVMNIEWPSLLQVLREHSWTAYPTIIVSGFLSHHEAEVVSRLTRPGSHRLVWRHEEESWPTLIFSAARTNKEEVDGTLEGEPRLV